MCPHALGSNNAQTAGETSWNQSPEFIRLIAIRKKVFDFSGSASNAFRVGGIAGLDCGGSGVFSIAAITYFVAG